MLARCHSVRNVEGRNDQRIEQICSCQGNNEKVGNNPKRFVIENCNNNKHITDHCRYDEHYHKKRRENNVPRTFLWKQDVRLARVILHCCPLFAISVHGTNNFFKDGQSSLELNLYLFPFKFMEMYQAFPLTFSYCHTQIINI